jgi:hypothetical protein
MSANNLTITTLGDRGPCSSAHHSLEKVVGAQDLASYEGGGGKHSSMMGTLGRRNEDRKLDLEVVQNRGALGHFI